MTFHRALGFVDRSVLTDDSPLRVVMASEGRMADKIDLRMAGADLGRFRGNPVLGYGHSYWGRTNLPIGRVDPGSLTIEGTRLSGDLEFDQEDEFARLVERKMRGGFINAVSIGFDVTQWESAEDNYWRGGVATKWELTELSVVPVPMDANALVTSGRQIDDDEVADLLRRIEGALRSGRGPMILSDPEIRPIPDDPAPTAPEINQDAARSLLAAFAPKEN
ncbi:HK97 family phage prohead protease [Actinoplanes sp. NBC_00393]|uniref:HK97 family phage prohead protease n=1 Tax=Actinoplanes sp. NBC_00393 TaxID=2975953 RepID=UPI002E24B776